MTTENQPGGEARNPPENESLTTPSPARHTVKKRTGRPTKLTDGRMKRICKHIEDGVPPEHAACIEDVGRATFYKWTSQGRQKAGIYRDFVDAIEKAKATALARCITVIRKAADSGTWQAAAWFAERQHPDEFALRQKVDVHQNIEPVKLEVKNDGPDVDRIAAILDVLTSVGAIPPLAGPTAPGTVPEP